MSKHPYIPLYIGDWERDTRGLSVAAIGALLLLTFKLFDAPKRGEFEANFRMLSGLWGTDLDTTKHIFTEIFLDYKVLDFTDIEDSKFIIKSRRMLKETAISEIRSVSGKKSAANKKLTKRKQTTNKTSTKHQQITDIDIDNDIENKNNKLFIISGDFQKIFDRWLAHKKSRGEGYKSEDSKQTALKKLFRFSGGDIQVAEEIIDDAIGNNWAGFFEPKALPVKKGGFVA